MIYYQIYSFNSIRFVKQMGIKNLVNVLLLLFYTLQDACILHQFYSTMTAEAYTAKESLKISLKNSICVGPVMVLLCHLTTIDLKLKGVNLSGFTKTGENPTEFAIVVICPNLYSF